MFRTGGKTATYRMLVCLGVKAQLNPGTDQTGKRWPLLVHLQVNPGGIVDSGGEPKRAP